jgi:hypothetical protein
MSLRHKVKAGLDETRLLILGAQVLFGFKLSSVFQEGFAELSHVTRIIDCAGQFLMALAIGLLIAPSNIRYRVRSCLLGAISRRQSHCQSGAEGHVWRLSAVADRPQPQMNRNSGGC